MERWSQLKGLAARLKRDQGDDGVEVLGDLGKGVRHVDGEAFDRVVVHGREQRLPVRRVDLVGRYGLELVHVKGADGEGDLGWVRALVLVVDRCGRGRDVEARVVDELAHGADRVARGDPPVGVDAA